MKVILKIYKKYKIIILIILTDLVFMSAGYLNVKITFIYANNI